MSDTTLRNLANLKSQEVRQRLDRLRAEEKALKVLLRATLARERAELTATQRNEVSNA